ncbi:flagellar basal body rod modification protein [Massilia atriviolacea]|uniref:Basal-body rod modification protein FlgD n=1 Tax=Massilia atriviolacea TaxID=2495579 RepID=A0A430HDN5_9BURK|nr:flagellar hook capping FlgD N-terminal domain-containing protein [Massilia atriviolacea]RSZ55648.1 flagellar basal body rod modification protein [Massilia atriviolacea]
MLTNNLNGASNQTAANASTVIGQAPASETQDMFTKLLVAQIRNQDPLEPSDPAQFVNQLSQLSQTEAMQSLAKLNSTSASVLESIQTLALGAQVGSDITVATSSVRLDGTPLKASITLGAASATNTVTLTGADGVKHDVQLGSRGSGPQTFSIDPVALGLAPGKYDIKVQTSAGAQDAIDVIGRLDSVRMSAGGGVILKVAGIGDVAPSSVTGFNGKSGASLAAANSSTAN